MAPCRFVFGGTCVHHPLPIVLSYAEVLFCGYLRLKLLFMAVCLTLVDYFVVLYGSVILRVLFELMLRFLVFRDVVSDVSVNAVLPHCYVGNVVVLAFLTGLDSFKNCVF
jgi:hypothetical protein